MFDRMPKFTPKFTRLDIDTIAEISLNLGFMLEAAIKSAPDDIDIFNVEIGNFNVEHPKKNTPVNALKAWTRAGFSIRLNKAERFSRDLHRMCAALEREFRCPAFVNIYMHPKMSRGLGEPHVDDHDVLIVQAVGNRNWVIDSEVSEIPMRPRTLLPHEVLDYSSGWPTPNEGDAALLRSSNLGFVNPTEFTIKPGMMIYIPAGCVHQASTAGDYSIHLTFGIHHFRVFDALLVALQRITARDTRLRQPIFLHRKANQSSAPDPYETLIELIPALLTNVKPDYIKDVLWEMRERFSMEQKRSIGLWDHQDGEPQQRFEKTRRWRRLVEKNLIALRYNSTRARVSFPGGFIDIPRAAVPIVMYIRSHKEFEIDEILSLCALSHSDVALLLREFARFEVLR
ncbi:cupin domain-containing protein [Trinickia sp. EG282A]|uniref:JmjC domain-containing protein n=1 Tax=Trinickia sp. EG282A TaxID=3237013 RepID=UPI0034D34A4E